MKTGEKMKFRKTEMAKAVRMLRQGSCKSPRKGNVFGNASAENSKSTIDDDAEHAPQDDFWQQAKSLQTVGFVFDTPGPDLTTGGEDGEFDEGQLKRVRRRWRRRTSLVWRERQKWLQWPR